MNVELNNVILVVVSLIFPHTYRNNGYSNTARNSKSVLKLLMYVGCIVKCKQIGLQWY